MTAVTFEAAANLAEIEVGYDTSIQVQVNLIFFPVPNYYNGIATYSTEHK